MASGPGTRSPGSCHTPPTSWEEGLPAPPPPHMPRAPGAATGHRQGPQGPGGPGWGLPETSPPTMAEKGRSVSKLSPPPPLLYLPTLHSTGLLPSARYHTLHWAGVGPEDTAEGDKPLFRENPPPRQAEHRPQGQLCAGPCRGARGLGDPAGTAPVVTLETDCHQRGRQGCKPTAESRAGAGGWWQESASEQPVQACRGSGERHRPWSGENVARVSRGEMPGGWGPVCLLEGFCLKPRARGATGQRAQGDHSWRSVRLLCGRTGARSRSRGAPRLWRRRLGMCCPGQGAAVGASVKTGGAA